MFEIKIKVEVKVVFELEGSSIWRICSRWRVARKQPPRHIAEISVRRGVPSWKLSICSLIFKKDFPENPYLFDSKKKCSWKIVICSVAKKSAPGKLVSVRWLFKGAFVKLVSVQ